MREIAELLTLGLCAFAVISQAPSRPQLRYIGEVGNASLSLLSRVTVNSQGSTSTLVEGKDDLGNPWTALLRTESGLGWTDLWQADFDHNGRSDLLLAAFFPSNGRCIDEVSLSFLLFDDHGRPVPWVVRTRVPESRRSPMIPGIFADLNHTGRTQLVVTDCTYSDSLKYLEDRRVNGVYEAIDATWKLVRPSTLPPYNSLLRQNHNLRPNFGRLLPTNPAAWTDHGNDLHSNEPKRQIAKIRPAAIDCLGMRPTNGRLQVGWKDSCDELERARIQLSDGTACYGWPVLIIDRANGREIDAVPSHAEALLQELADQHRNVILGGQNEPGRCRPTVLWAP